MPADRSTAIRRDSIPSQAEEFVRNLILDGTLGAGERLNEVALAESIGISRGPLREAIKRLSGQGYLTMEAHRGAFVKSYEPREIVDLYELRSALELYAVRLTVERASDESLTILADRLAEESERIRHYEDQPQSEPYVAELDFHQQLVALSGNRAIQDQLADAIHKLYIALRPTRRTPTRMAHAVAAHLEVLDRVRQRDADGALALLTEHMRDSMDNSLSVMGLSATAGADRSDDR
ncbi:GntR family transcriptional regulator [Agromyces silvae]|uniref:GntR family transcriptional regulator n=1 Tax=Agromyces silvae TaxID=3388266 RepID=UPI00280A85F1|nr:GntR family transcriptional regulator [Agromyces protaetiae]